MKKMIWAVLLSGLMSTGLPDPPSEKTEPFIPAVSIAEVLEAHHVPQDRNALSGFIAEAVKLTTYDDGSGTGSSTFFERRVSVSVSGDAFRRYRTDPARFREKHELFDGLNAHQAVVENGKRIEAITHLSGAPLEAVKFSVRTFGLVPILNQLLHPGTEVTFMGRTARKWDKFSVKTSAGGFSLSCDQWQVIRAVEIGSKVIEYADYRTVEGVRLPFIQRLSSANRLLYELVFTRIDLSPEFPAGYFTRQAL